MPLPLARVTLVTALSAALLVACGGSTPLSSPTPTPLTAAQIQARYRTAASLYNQSAAQIAAVENNACDASSPTVALAACQAALSEQRQSTIAYDNALRATPFGGNAATLAGHLLGDDSAIESLLQQAATAPSLAVIATLQQQIIPLLATAARDATALRAEIGLPAPA